MKLHQNELKILSEYKFIGDEFIRSQKNRNENEFLLCLRENETGFTIDRVRREDATAFEIFKSYLGMGKLAGCTLSLEKMASYLAERDLASLSSEAPAYQTIHAIAARALVYRKGSQDLWKKLSTTMKSLDIRWIHRWKEAGYYDHDSVVKTVNRAFLITPLTRIGHLTAQAEMLADESWHNPSDKEDPYRTETRTWGWGTTCQTAEANEKNLKGLYFNLIKRIDYIH